MKDLEFKLNMRISKNISWLEAAIKKEIKISFGLYEVERKRKKKYLFLLVDYLFMLLLALSSIPMQHLHTLLRCVQ